MSLAKIAIFLLWLGAVIDPVGNVFGLRYVAIFLTFAAIFYFFIFDKIQFIDFSYRLFFVFFIAGFFPIYGLVLYSFRTAGGDFVDTSYIASGVIAAACLLYTNKKMCLFGLKSFIFSARLLSFLVIFVYVFLDVVSDDFLNFFIERNVALFSVREYSGVVFPYIYFFASPLLIFLMAHDFGFFKKKPNMVRFLIFIFTAFSFGLTGTRAHMLIAVIFVPAYIILRGSGSVLVKIFISLIVASPVIFFIDVVSDVLSSFFSGSESSNLIKISMLNGYVEIFSNPMILIFGQGFNAHEWSPFLRDMIAMDIGASKTELTYIELVRVFGLFFGFIFVAFLLRLLQVAKNLDVEFEWIYPGLFFLLINASINPYLFSTNGMLPLGLIVAIVHHYKKSKISVF